MVTVPTCCSCSHQDQKQDGRGVTMASVSHPSDWNSEKTWQTNPTKAQFCAAACTAICTTPPCWRLFPCIAAAFSTVLLCSLWLSSARPRWGLLCWVWQPWGQPHQLSACSSPWFSTTVNLHLSCLPPQHYILQLGSGENRRGMHGGGRGQRQGPDFKTFLLEREKQNDADFHREFSFSSVNHAPHQWLSGTMVSCTPSLQPGHFLPLMLYHAHYAQISSFPNIYIYIYIHLQL